MRQAVIAELGQFERRLWCETISLGVDWGLNFGWPPEQVQPHNETSESESVWINANNFTDQARMEA